MGRFHLARSLYSMHIIYVHFSANFKLDDPISVSDDPLRLKTNLWIIFPALAFNGGVCPSPLQIMSKFWSRLYSDICHRHKLYKCKCNLPVLLEILIVCSCTAIFGIKAVFASIRVCSDWRPLSHEGISFNHFWRGGKQINVNTRRLHTNPGIRLKVIWLTLLK